MDIIIRYSLVILVMVCVIFPSISYGGGLFVSGQARESKRLGDR
jgi:hypothetical protein